MVHGSDDCYDVGKALTTVEIDNDRSILINALTEMRQNLRLMSQSIQGIHSRLDSMDSRLDSIEGRLDKIEPLMLYVLVSENLRRRNSGLPQLPVPFVVGDGPQNMNLPPINSLESIEDLNKTQVKRYLDGYAVDYDANADRIELKALLRDTLGYSSGADLRFDFT